MGQTTHIRIGIAVLLSGIFWTNSNSRVGFSEDWTRGQDVQRTGNPDGESHKKSTIETVTSLLSAGSGSASFGW